MMIRTLRCKQWDSSNEVKKLFGSSTHRGVGMLVLRDTVLCLLWGIGNL